MTRILITGGSGFVGRQAVQILRAQGHDVHAPSRAEMDVLDHAQTARVIREIAPTHLLHFAWIATPGVYQESPENEAWKDASLALFRAAVDSGTTRIVSAGTCFEYAWPATPCMEDETPIAPATFYGQCKDACCQELLSLAGDRGISAAWGRIFFLYGPHEYEQRLISSVITTLLRGGIAECTHGRQVRDFSYVKDIAGGFATLLLSETPGAVNIASGEAVTLKELVTTAARIIGAEDRVVFGAREAPANEPPVIAADVTKLQATGWKRQYTHEQALQETIAWWKTQL